MGSIRQSLQAQPKYIKNIETPNQVYIVLQKCKGAKHSYGGYPTEFAGPTQNPKKIIRTPNLPIRTKIFPKKTVSNLKSVKEPKFRVGVTRRSLQPQPKMLKKIVGISNQPIRANIFPKKVFLVS
jgi:hypothetical protein